MFSLNFTVRDYECDLQGIVNNANYQHYLEHARHQFLIANNIDFAELTRVGVLLIVTRIELDYKAPLRPNEAFSVSVLFDRVSPIRFVFDQDIHRADGQLCLRARVLTSAMGPDGRPLRPRVVEPFLAKLLN